MEFFIFFIIFILLQKLFEIWTDKRHERWLIRNGAVQIANKHYKWFSSLHSLFFICLIIEASWKIIVGTFWINWFLIFFFILAQISRGWCMSSLGRFWNSKLYVMNNVIVFKRGPYRLIQHPEYVIIFIELLVMPLMFQAYISAVIFPTLYIFVVMLRISELEKLSE